MDKNRINYEEYLKKPFWNLHEAIFCISGNKKASTNLFGHEFFVKQNDTLTYATAIKAIKAKELKIKLSDLLILDEKEIERITEENQKVEKQIQELEDKKSGLKGLGLIALGNKIRGIRDNYSNYSLYLKKTRLEKVPFVKPREFIRWCGDRQIYVVPELMKYFNYQYWLDKKHWSFDEVVMILLSDKPPFPNEIVNVFELDEQHNEAAKSMLYLIKECRVWFFCYHNIDDKRPVHFIGWDEFKDSGLDIRDARFYKNKIFKLYNDCGISSNSQIVNEHMSNYVNSQLSERENRDKTSRGKIKRLELDGEIGYNQKIFQQESLNKIVIEIDDAFNLLSGVSGYEEEREGVKCIIPNLWHSQYWNESLKWLRARYDNKKNYKKLFFHDKKNGKTDFIINERYHTKTKKLLGDVAIKDFINWAKGHNIPIPPELENKPNPALTKTTTLPEYTTPYVQLMFGAIQHFNITKDNQPEVKKLTSYLEDGLRRITEDPNHRNPANKAKMMATFLRLPEKQKGGNISNEKIKKHKKG